MVRKFLFLFFYYKGKLIWNNKKIILFSTGYPVVLNEFIQLHKSDLHIKNVNKTLSGDYVCIAKFSSTNARESSRTAHLNVMCKLNYFFK